MSWFVRGNGSVMVPWGPRTHPHRPHGPCLSCSWSHVLAEQPVILLEREAMWACKELQDHFLLASYLPERRLWDSFSSLLRFPWCMRLSALSSLLLGTVAGCELAAAWRQLLSNRVSLHLHCSHLASVSTLPCARLRGAGILGCLHCSYKQYVRVGACCFVTSHICQDLTWAHSLVQGAGSQTAWIQGGTLESWGGRGKWNIKQFLKGNGFWGLAPCGHAKVRGTQRTPTVRVYSTVMGTEKLLPRWLEILKIARNKDWIAVCVFSPLLFCVLFCFVSSKGYTNIKCWPLTIDCGCFGG